MADGSADMVNELPGVSDAEGEGSGDGAGERRIAAVGSSSRAWVKPQRIAG